MSFPGMRLARPDELRPGARVYYSPSMIGGVLFSATVKGEGSLPRTMRLDAGPDYGVWKKRGPRAVTVHAASVEALWVPDADARAERAEAERDEARRLDAANRWAEQRGGS